MMLKLALINAVRKTPGMRATLWRVRSGFHILRRHILVRRPVINDDSSIENAIVEGLPFATGKMGSTEVQALHTCLRRHRERSNGRKISSYDPYIFYTLYVNSGVFPKTEETFDRFGNVYLDAVKNCDALVAWDVACEAEILRDYCTETVLITMHSLEPFFSTPPWSRVLKGKRVLVVSPFVDSITKQYAKREDLWDNPEMLPAFDLLTLRCPFSAALVPPEAQDWFEALDRLKTGMDAIDFDVALIGAGAFSLPLAAHAKSRGRIGVHLGGSLQIMFGVAGKRWREMGEFKAFIKPSWCNPSKDETPSNIQMNEGGCYW